MRIRQLMMQMAEMTDAQARNFEDEDGIAVFLKGFVIAPAVADIGCDIANIDIAYQNLVFGLFSRRIAPAMQHILNGRVRTKGEVGRMRPVHRYYRRHDRRAIDAVIVRGDRYPAWAFDQIGGMADEADLHLFLRRRLSQLNTRRTEARKHDAGNVAGDRLALTDGRAAFRLGEGRSR
ncbi:hypothetical protein D3C78_1025800 [compost metagenome]